MKERVVIGTRGSDLALWQAYHVRDELQRAHEGIEVEIEVIKTTGDVVLDRQLKEIGGKGLFIKEIEVALREERIDLAVHSLKDMPWDQPDDLAIVCVPERGAAFDMLCAREEGATLDALPEGARVGTGSLRRIAQLRHLRPDIEPVPIRGNVQTRLSKRDPATENLDAVVLAQAGLERLEIHEPGFSLLAPPEFLPAPGQGALGIEIRADDGELRALLSPLHHAPTELLVEAERACLHGVDGDCHTPFAAFATRNGDTLHLIARLMDDETGRVTERQESVSLAEAEDTIVQARALGARVAAQLVDAHGDLQG